MRKKSALIIAYLELIILAFCSVAGIFSFTIVGFLGGLALLVLTLNGLRIGYRCSQDLEHI
jgi:hypothetical protein